jgi:vanillate O-demethylase ferredoxin subunit
MNSATIWCDAQVASIRDLNNDVRLFELVTSTAFAPAPPGSHVDVAVEINGRPATRSYSLLGPGNAGTIEIAVKLSPDSRGGSAYMWALRPGAKLRITAPINHFVLNRDCSEFVLIAGGIGVTPIYSMAKALAAGSANYRVLYGARSKADFVLADELKDLAGHRLQLYCGEEKQRIDIAAAIDTLPADGELYICGPIGMLDEARDVWSRSGRPAEKLRFETFGNSGRFPNTAFTVHLPHIGKSVEVSPRQSLLEALESAGIETMYDCRRGECGLCALDVTAVDGVIDHRDVFFSAEEKAEGHKLCACVSRIAGASVTVDTGERPA